MPRYTMDFGDKFDEMVARLAQEKGITKAELIRRAALLVTNDSSPQHLASAMGTPTITLFGPTVPAFGFGPLAPRSIALGTAGLDCRPCHHHGPQVCPLQHWRCMRELTAGDVVRAVETILCDVSYGSRDGSVESRESDRR